jgi:hypothetical protein
VVLLLSNNHQESIKGKQKSVIKPTKNRTADAVKALLHNAAMSAIQYCQEIKEYYHRKIAEGKNKMLVINNVCNNGAARAVGTPYFCLYFSKRKI